MIEISPNYDIVIAMKAANEAKYNLTDAWARTRQACIADAARIVGPNRVQAYITYLAAGAKNRIHARTQEDLAYIEGNQAYLNGLYLEACGKRGKAAMKCSGYKALDSPWVRKMAIYNALAQGITPDGIIHCLSQKIKDQKPGSGPARRMNSDIKYIQDNREDLETRVLNDIKRKQIYI